MAFQIVTDAHKLTYRENVALAVQQKQSRLAECCTYQPNIKGKQSQVIELLGGSEVIEDGARGEDTPHIEPSMEQVWMTPRQGEWGRLVEREDNLKGLFDYQSYYVQEAAASFQRWKDRLITNAIFGPRRVGPDGAQVNEAFSNPNGSVAVNYVASGAAVNSGLTFSKIVRGLSILGLTEDDTDSDPVFVGYTNRQMENLYEMIQFVSADYRSKMVLDEGTKTVQQFMGIRFVRLRASLLPVSANVRGCPMWVKSGMHYAEAVPMESNADRNPQKKYRVHMYNEMYACATRSEDAKVVRIDCLET